MAAKQTDNGFLIVASRHVAYYTAAVNLANSILDFMPDAKISLFTSKDFIRNIDRDLFDKVELFEDILPEGNVQNNPRAKLWALSRTPYKITAYVDADCEVRHEDITTIFDQIGDVDIMLTKIRKYSGADVKISRDGTETLLWHCGVFLYKNKKKVLEFMSDWWDEWIVQENVKEWPWPNHRSAMQPWDQYTFYRLYTSKKYSSLKLDVFPGEDARWNYVWNYKDDEATKPPIIYHYTIPVKEMNLRIK